MEEQEQIEQPENGTAKGVKTIGVLLIIGGIIGGLIINGEASSYMISDELETYYRTIAISVGVSGIVSGTLFIGISEIIKLLFSINAENKNIN